MINRRIILFGLIVVLGLTALTVGKSFIDNRMSIQDDEIQVVRSDEYQFEELEAEEDGMRKTVLYFKNSENYLVPVMRRLPWEEGIAKATINNMIDSPELRESLKETGLLPVIPAGTEILGISINDETGLCKINFSENLLNSESEKEEESLIKGIVYTLTEFPAVEKVQMLVSGKEISNTKHGNNISGTIARENINLIGNLDQGKSKVVVYYKGQTDNNYEYYVPMTVPTLAPIANVYSALDMLFEGPPEDLGFHSEIPDDIKLYGIEVKNGTAYVDISLDTSLEETSEVNISDIIKNIGLTLSEFEEIETVELLIDGEIINSTVPVFANEY